MTRSARQSKILELISTKEIETQDELARELRNVDFEITQATISRDIKELGLTKILSSSGRYKYTFVGGEENAISNKYISILKESIISVKPALNLIVIKTIKGLGGGIANFIDKLNISSLMGVVNGDDMVMLIFPSTMQASEAVITLNDMLL